jgi:Zn-dependent peptidase ImmA (M78 family)
VATSTPAYVTPKVLRWARESGGFSLEEAAEKIPIRPDKLASAERGEHLLTLRQAEKAAEIYDRPLAALFLTDPPTEEAPEQQFRRLPDAPKPPWLPPMHALARRVRQRQEAAAEIYELLEETPPWLDTKSRFKVGIAQLAWKVRDVLGIALDEQLDWRDSSGYAPLRHWIDAIESLGVLVMQNGDLPVDLMRGFASPHPTAPGIVLNSQDDPRARAFTSVHELGHLCLGEVGHRLGSETERWCDRFAGEVLMPSRDVIRHFADIRKRELLEKVDEIALAFGVTPLAAAVRLGALGIFSKNQTTEVIAEIRRRKKAPKGGGGEYYNNQIARLGPSFIQLVFSALDGQVLTYPAASGLLGVKVNNFDTLRQKVKARSQSS